MTKKANITMFKVDKSAHFYYCKLLAKMIFMYLCILL